MFTYEAQSEIRYIRSLPGTSTCSSASTFHVHNTSLVAGGLSPVFDSDRVQQCLDAIISSLSWCMHVIDHSSYSISVVPDWVIMQQH